MRKRARIALAILLLGITGIAAFRVLYPADRGPVYQGKPLRAWLRDYAGWDTTPKEWAQAKIAAEEAIRHIGTNAIPTLLKLVQKREPPRMSRLIDWWDQQVANRNGFPIWLRHPSWYKNQARYMNLEGEIGFKILGAEAQKAVPDLILIYESTLSMDSVTAMFSRGAASHSLINIGPPAIPYFLSWADGTNEGKRLTAAYALSQIHGEPSLVVPVLVKFLSHTNPLVRTEVVEGLGNFGTNAQPALPALVQSLSDSNRLVRNAATNAFKQINPEMLTRVGVQ
ncbi:MAG TPA: HEAT repeat domain-containing protein [Patescibacteria group bacterium]|jgi:hypothetical protein|nr:HEAT repeat domain-containing protein [Patescibacteria group bacterium]